MVFSYRITYDKFSKGKARKQKRFQFQELIHKGFLVCFALQCIGNKMLCNYLVFNSLSHFIDKKYRENNQKLSLVSKQNKP